VKIIALYNLKGGVGKTATAVNLAHLSALAGARTLVWDLDAQGAATYCFRVRAGGGEGLLAKKHKLKERIKATDHPGLDLLPADFSNRELDLLLGERKHPERRLATLLETIDGDYEHVYLDCPPSLSLLSQAVFVAAHALVVPVLPSPLSLRALDQLRGHLAGQDDRPRVLPFFSMVDRRKRLHRETCESTREGFLEARIPYATAVEQMSARQEPLAEHAPKSEAARQYQALWQEIFNTLEQK
jgi:cellulose biosynthesis protein BcsQ